MGRSGDNGAVPDGWRMVRLGDLVTLSQGGTPRKNEPAYWGGHVPFVTGADLTDFRVSRDHARSFLTPKGLRSGTTVVCKPGDLLLATRTRVGLAGIATDVMGASQDITRLVANGRVRSDYLCRALMKTAHSLQKMSRGTTIQGITRGDVEALPILLPPLPEQRAIAAVLDGIDEAIERTDAVIAATERLRDSLLHDLLTRGVPGWHTEWKEAPGIGTIPTDWAVVRLGDVCSPPQYGAAAAARDHDPSLPRYVRITDLTDDGHLRPDDARSAAPREVTGFELLPGDLLFARSGATVGKTYMYQAEDGPCVFAGYLIRFQSHREQADPRFLSLWTHSLAYWKWVASMFRAGAQPNINAAEYASMPIPRPPLHEQRTIAETLRALDKSIEAGKRQCELLAASKTSAADALLTGQVRLP
ncbi:MAG: restriction endonuclease subunit S [Chloroflexota bacterium]|nr:restriction endonuclease subunit S [Chloroflexota bacterium]MDE2940732.1 restriction endonuclease subunit S [Chloroflexota bacterium]MDE3268527.1 restriction endonuclease subunit S [Chloroflexota bacterium]